ncbi:MAG: 30S ribosomal protein S17 [Candidatus Brocadia sp. AMX3]|nr:30S ribosomal protein S17 [Candidatus Brocadia fulgida]MCC6325651.1 30S ribosomal protein S17 [Candidatus Brocadia sp.]MCE7912028.1 30S ribosomal protein S17 [Candidatus Brocadia sp. AMX3]MDG5997100.1 30S ribosomal protein S17 [Candidatus Brocadia sp.]
MDTDNVRGRRRKVVGMVIGDKMQKTIVVEVTRMIRHSRYGKYIKRSIIYKAHDENRQAKVGDKVEIIETRPLSKTKSTRLVRIVEKANR